jgi:ADP-ribose pyrophosphatase
MSHQVELLNRETVYQGFFRVDKLRLRVEKFEGGWSEPMDREVFHIGRAVVGLLYDPQLDHIILIEQFRPAPYVYGQPAFLYECIAGLLEKDEAPDMGLRREAFEEAGVTIKRLEPVGEIFSSPGAVDELWTLYVAEIDASHAGGVFGLKAEHENIKVHVMPAATAITMLDAGQIKNAPAVIALSWFARHGEKLRDKWTHDQSI